MPQTKRKRGKGEKGKRKTPKHREKYEGKHNRCNNASRRRGKRDKIQKRSDGHFQSRRWYIKAVASPALATSTSAGFAFPASPSASVLLLLFGMSAGLACGRGSSPTPPAELRARPLRPVTPSQHRISHTSPLLQTGCHQLRSRCW